MINVIRVVDNLVYYKINGVEVKTPLYDKKKKVTKKSLIKNIGNLTMFLLEADHLTHKDRVEFIATLSGLVMKLQEYLAIYDPDDPVFYNFAPFKEIEVSYDLKIWCGCAAINFLSHLNLVILKAKVRPHTYCLLVKELDRFIQGILTLYSKHHLT